MDQKSENRRRFQDKQRLKRAHQTPSDRKYRKPVEQVREEKVLPSNHERYVDIPIDQGEDITKYTELTKKVRATTEPDTAGPEHQQYTSRQIQSMGTDELNALLRNNVVHNVENDDSHVPAEHKRERPGTPQAKETVSVSVNKPSLVPEELAGDEDFLDSIL